MAKKRVKRDFTTDDSNEPRFRAYRSAPNDPEWRDMWYLVSHLIFLFFLFFLLVEIIF